MNYLGRATNIKLTKKLNGTHSLTFQLPDRFYDSEKGDYVKNEFVDQLFNEKKVKLKYMDEWYEFYIKNISDAKQFKSYMKTYTCTDAFIDELSRNGYGIIFDEQLYNNVEEVGTFTEEILEDSIWEYAPEHNWGDFTEYTEEKLYRIPVSLFENGKIYGYEINYDIEDTDEEIVNAFTNKKRDIEMGDDLARNKYFWDQYSDMNPKNKLLKELKEIENDGYIYVFMTDLDFCYQTTSDEVSLTATEEAQMYDDKSYALAPISVDPNHLIQFMAFPIKPELNIDDNGMITNKNYHYVMTVRQWNENVIKKYFYQFESIEKDSGKNFKTYAGEDFSLLEGNYAVYYDGYLSEVNGVEIDKAKKISITDRTEINISEDIDQYVTVYNNHSNEYNFINPDGKWVDSIDVPIDYRVCSVTKTRQIVPQLARNLIENAINIKSDDGWAVAAMTNDLSDSSAAIKYVKSETDSTNEQTEKDEDGYLEITPATKIITTTDGTSARVIHDAQYNTIINFGIVGQDYSIEKDKVYCFGIDAELAREDSLNIRAGAINGSGNYELKEIKEGGFSLGWGELNGAAAEANPEEDIPLTDEEKKTLNYIHINYPYKSYVTYPPAPTWTDEIENDTKEIKDRYTTKYNSIKDFNNEDKINRIEEILSSTTKERQKIDAEWAAFNGYDFELTASTNGQHDNILYIVLTYVKEGTNTSELMKHWNWSTTCRRCDEPFDNLEGVDTAFKIFGSEHTFKELNDDKNNFTIKSYSVDNLSAEKTQDLIIQITVLNSDSYVSRLKYGESDHFKETEIVGGMSAIQIEYVAHETSIRPGITDKRPIRFQCFYKKEVFQKIYDKEIAAINLIDYDKVKDVYSEEEFKMAQTVGVKTWSDLKEYEEGQKKAIDLLSYLIPINGNIEKTISQEINNYLKLKQSESSEGQLIDKKIFFFVSFNQNIKNPYFGLVLAGPQINRIIHQVYFFEAYTKGIDQFDSNAEYKYSGRELFKSVLNEGLLEDQKKYFLKSNNYSEDVMRNKVIFENDVMSGDTYGYQKYFIQQAYTKNYDEGEEKILISDTFMAKKFLDEDAQTFPFNKNTQNVSVRELPYSSKQYSNDEVIISTNYIDLNNCQYYNKEAGATDKDCSYADGEGYCLYQKYGYCPYLFETEKHCRRIRTMKAEKSNRFNLTQEASKIFKVYPIYYIDHDSIGKVKKDENDEMIKKVFYITEKGIERPIGFRYGINLSNISRTLKSDQIVTKLYVQDVDSQLSKTGLSTIKLAPSNISKDNFIIDFSYYIQKGILNKNGVERDLYGFGYTDKNGETIYDLGFLRKMGNLNSEYDKLSDLIINLTSKSYTELEANVKVNLDGIETAQQQLNKLKKQRDRYKNSNENTYNNYQEKINEQVGILYALSKELLCNEVGQLDGGAITEIKTNPDYSGITDYKDFFDYYPLNDFKESKWVKEHQYLGCGMLGQYNTEYAQIQKWKKQQAAYLSEINSLSVKFYKKYEPYLKEGTWSDSNYLTDEAYYQGAVQVSAQGAIPKVEYTISVIDLKDLEKFRDYYFDIADTTYVEDVGMFGINQKTGLPNKLKVLISEISYDLDQPKNNSIKIQNYTTSFEDLFQQVSASVQSLSFNENIYKRSGNFSSDQSINQSSLQGALNKNDVTLINTQESNIKLDSEGTMGSDINNHSNQYKLNGQGLYFSNNGGQSWNIGVGPGGINADYIKVGTLDAGKIRIMDNDYLYFYWDKSGIVALKDPTRATNTDSVNDFTVFNKYGLSIVENGKIRLRSGYKYADKYAGTDENLYGYYNNEIQDFSKIGFFLYDSFGNPIFSTSNEQGELSAKISLSGELFCGDAITSDKEEYVYKGKNELKDITVHKRLTNKMDTLEAISNILQINLDNYKSIELIYDGGTISRLTSTLDKIFESQTSIILVTKNFVGNSYDISYGGTEILDYSPLLIQFEGEFSTQDIKAQKGDTLKLPYTHAFYELEIENNKPKNGNEKTRIDSVYINNVLNQVSHNTYDVTEKGWVHIDDEEHSFLEQLKSTTIGDKTVYMLDWDNTTYYEEYIGSRKVDQGNKAQYGVFINNLDVKNKIKDKRILSAVKDNANYLDNLFTVYNNGEVYIGGYIEEEGGKKISNYSANDKVTQNKGTYFRVANGEIFFKHDSLGDREVSLGQLLAQIAKDASDALREATTKQEDYTDSSIDDLKETSSHVHEIRSNYTTLSADDTGYVYIGENQSIVVCTNVPQFTEYGRLT